MKENVRNVSQKQENMRLNSVNWKTIRKVDNSPNWLKNIAKNPENY